ACGVGGTTAVFSLLRAAFAAPPYPHGERLVHVWGTWPGGAGNLGFPDFAALVEQNVAFEGLAAYESWGGVALSGRERPVMLRTSFVTRDYLEMLGARAALGRTFLAEENGLTSARPVVVLSDACWRRDFGADSRLVGRAVRLNDSSYTVIGVLAPGFLDLGVAEGDGPPDVWLPAATAPALLGQPALTEPYRIYWAVGLLRPGVSLAAARENLAAVAARRARESPAVRAGAGLELQSLAERMGGPVRQPARLLFAGALLILLLGCVNLANATLVRCARRRGELALRRTLGASPRRLGQQLLTEAAVLALLGAAASLLVAVAATRTLGGWVQTHVAPLVGIPVDGATLLAAGALAVATLLLFGVVPAFAGSRADLQATLRGAGGKGSSGGGSRPALVVAEVALSMTLLVGAGLMARSVSRLLAGSMGFDTRDLLTFRLDLGGDRYGDNAARTRFFAALDERLRAVPGVRSATLLGPSMLGRATWVMSVLPREREAPRPDDFVQAFRHSVNPGALRNLGIPLLRGRELDAHDTGDAPPVAVISAQLARRLWGTVDVVGRELQRTTGETLKVVGVAGDAQHRDRYSLGDVAAGIGPCGVGPQLDVYLPYAQRPNPSITAALRIDGIDGDPVRVAEAVRAAIAELDGALPLSDVAMLDDRLRAQERAPQAIARLFAAYAGFALFLAALGLHGVIAQSVQQRTREIGIRLALGARGRDVLRRYLGGGLALAALGVALGALGAAALARAMASLLFGVAPFDPATFLLVAASLLAMALVASFLPVRWVLGRRPVAVLRAD
ncbi:MAG TPA: ADOP family duplicated permease, partial [Thermoanaerobaculia bacterium]|nr:ADOP family duplicated permease [Thermoanaerobaculia bacterium]